MGSKWKLNELATCCRNSLVLTTSDKLTNIPFIVITGTVRDPVALIIAGVHGDEFEGPAAIQDLMLEIEPTEVQGSIIFVPVANPSAFASATRRHPLDNGDVNRSFPGSLNGGPTQQLAHDIFHEFALNASSILSLHGWSKEASVVPYAEYSEDNSPAARASQEVARRLGFQYLHPYRWPSGVLGDAVLAHGIPIVEVEVGGMGTITAQGQALCRDVILRFLAHFGIIEFDAASPPEPVLVSHYDLLSSSAGLFRSLVEVGDHVEAGHTIGTVHGLNGSLLETVRASEAGTVAILRRLASVQPNDLLLQIFMNRQMA